MSLATTKKQFSRKGKTMDTKLANKLDKLFALYNDDAAKQSKESEAALNKIRNLCKKHKVDFEGYMAGKGVTVETPEAPKAEEPKTEAPAAPKAFAFRSRRNTILLLVKEGMWDKKSIAEAIVILSKGKYDNVKQNLKAVSGTVYDINAHTDNFIKTAEDGRLCFIRK
jgi:hypothetical protein